MLQGKRILITGGAGFIGSALVRSMAESGADVLIVDNLVNGKRQNVEEILSEHVRLTEVDIRDEDVVRPLLGGVDVVFHLACLGVRHSIHSPFENHDVNATGTLQLLTWARSEGVSRFVYVSSSEVYGTARYAPIPEDHPTLPHTVYGGSKLAGESYARAFWRSYGYPTVIIRPFNAYGPRSHHEGDSGEVIPKFMLRALAGRDLIVFGDGRQTRDFTYVDDTARGILEIGMCDDAVGQTVNIGRGEEITIDELAEQVIQVVGRQDVSVKYAEPRPGDVMRLWADTQAASELAGFHARMSLFEGLERLASWYRERGIDPDVLLSSEKIRNWEVAANDKSAA